MVRRIGNDIMQTWAVLTDDEPLSLEGRSLKLVMTDPKGKETELQFSTKENTLTFTLPGKDQKECGFYDFTLWENKEQSPQRVVDSYHELELVPHSFMEDC